jgi:hypothetical protein
MYLKLINESMVYPDPPIGRCIKNIAAGELQKA